MDPLKPWQQWCTDYLKDQPNVLICDDMGIGKTYEGCELDIVRRAQSPEDVTLIIAPIAVHQGDTSSWKETYERQTGLKAWVIDPKNRQKSWDEFAKGDEPGAFIMHYEAVRLMPQLFKHKWLHIILDECHRIQNRKAIQTKQIKKLKCVYKTALSGTPTTGHPDKFWSVLNWLYPRDPYYRSYWRFYANHVASIDAVDKQGNLLGYKVIIGPKNEKELLDRIRPFYVRRTKAQIKKDYPDAFDLKPRLPDSRRIVVLKPEQRRAYDAMRDQQIAWVKKQQAEYGDDMTPIMAQNAAVRAMRLQQFGVAYATTTPQWRRNKDGDMEEYDQVVLTEPSSKLDAIMEILDDNPDKPFVVFSNFRQLVDLFEARLKRKNIPYSIITGKVPAHLRGEEIRKFQDGETRVFTGTLAAGGVGITLTRADTMLLTDRHYSPAINEQAIARIDRIGQTVPTQVVDIVAQGTVDFSRIKDAEAKWSWVLRLLGDI
jgi:SNF2 family DNA or RNA helicase